MASLRRHYPDQVIRVGSRDFPLSLAFPGSPVIIYPYYIMRGCIDN